MGRKTAGIYPGDQGTWQVDKYWKGTRFRQRGFRSFEEAEGWLIRQLESKRTVVIHGERQQRTFEQAAAYYLLANQDKPPFRKARSPTSSGTAGRP